MSRVPDLRIRTVQCLCPKRHCVIATAYDPKEHSDDEVVEQLSDTIKRAISRTTLDPWCGICGSTDWHFEVGQTAFETMEEAMPHLRATEADNLRSRNAIRAQSN